MKHATSVASPNAIEGAYLCTVGQASTFYGERCGAVMENNYTYSGHGYTFTGMMQIRVCSQGGDSGSPFYSANQYGWGILSGGRTNDTCANSQGTDYAIVGYLKNALSAVNSTLYTGW